jgi:hypothetical protein
VRGELGDLVAQLVEVGAIHFHDESPFCLGALYTGVSEASGWRDERRSSRIGIFRTTPSISAAPCSQAPLERHVRDASERPPPLIQEAVKR